MAKDKLRTKLFGQPRENYYNDPTMKSLEVSEQRTPEETYQLWIDGGGARSPDIEARIDVSKIKFGE